MPGRPLSTLRTAGRHIDTHGGENQKIFPMAAGPVAGSRAGDDVTVDFEPYRGELVAYCYRVLGSVHEAEDLVQETMLRAWKARDRYDSTRASVRTWLYRIATNACLSALQGRGRRPLPSGLGAPSGDPGAPLTPALDIPWLQPFPDARYDVAVRADMRLALVAAMQLLPPRQRAVLILREVLEFSAAEVAAQLETTVPAVNSALQRARAALAGGAGADEVTEPGDPRARAVIQQYVEAFEAADVDGLVRLLTDDAVLEMPPVPLWYLGSRDYGRFMRRVFGMRGTGWAVRQLTANGQPAFAAYAPEPGGGHRLHTLQVLTVTGGRVARNVVFADPAVFATFGLAGRLPGKDSGRER
jgi:RNA polymerase sigma-70 factor (ECF subfamily)